MNKSLNKMIGISFIVFGAIVFILGVLLFIDLLRENKSLDSSNQIAICSSLIFVSATLIMVGYHLFRGNLK